MALHKNSRRTFLKTGFALAGASLIETPVLYANTKSGLTGTGEGDHFTFLFQGDSITDGNRTRNNDWNHVMGHGYAYIIASKLWYDFPEKKFHFYNRGISGNKITDLEQRWDTDTLALKPNLVSILIGINDTYAWINGDKQFTPKQFEEKYRALLLKTKNELPQVQFVLCEPFILPVENVKDKWDIYHAEVKKRQDIVQLLATEFNAIHIAFQQAFNTALKRAPASYWIWDGVHPMPAGHELMALEWIKQVRRKMKFIRK
ncbi:SGNH/GDSL hydrolase family protein [Agriterribacter sp.]|uniref:SGNH/GDSL hydrolase family protein n=1 Tax=Agriterribacter sp. TaxID=2821509 RepID=UPI002CE6B622|nr:SGNH/GDSL hydrolase family protein [Agriterribacter sp.]HTN06145.1 SGNH/GDSL hydrolase family protein [Agriterribacter sp.]